MSATGAPKLAQKRNVKPTNSGRKLNAFAMQTKTQQWIVEQLQPGTMPPRRWAKLEPVVLAKLVQLAQGRRRQWL